jgi:Obg family GTPase CgtA-like protein
MLVPEVDGEVLTMSSQAHQRVDEVLYALVEFSRAAREEAAAAAAAAEEAEDADAGPKIYELSQGQRRRTWHVEKRGDQYHIRGKKIERFALKTDPTSEAGTRRLFDIIDKMRINYELQRQGYTTKDTVVIAGKQFRR